MFKVETPEIAWENQLPLSVQHLFKSNFMTGENERLY